MKFTHYFVSLFAWLCPKETWFSTRPLPWLESWDSAWPRENYNTKFNSSRKLIATTLPIIKQRIPCSIETSKTITITRCRGLHRAAFGCNFLRAEAWVWFGGWGEEPCPAPPGAALTRPAARPHCQQISLEVPWPLVCITATQQAHVLIHLVNVVVLFQYI